MTAAAPVFVVGFGRSGTTLLASMVNAHPGIACGPETDFFDSLERYRDADPGAAATWPDAAVRFLSGIERENIGSVVAAYGLTESDIRRELEGRTPGVAALLEALTVPFARARGKDRWAEKTPRHLMHLAAIRRHWPDARIVRIVRDPRAVTAAYLGVPFGRSTVVGVAYHWRRFDAATWRFFERDTGSLTLRFEDLVRDTERELRRLCAFVDEPFDERMLRPAEASADVVASGEWWKSRTGREIDPTRVDAWRDELSAQDAARIARICAEGLSRYGYETDAQRIVEVGVHPPGSSLLADDETLGRAADRSVVFIASDLRAGHAHARAVIWGARGELRWSRRQPLATAGGLLRASASMLVRRVRGRPVLWIEHPASVRRGRGLADRVGDGVARLLARRVTPEQALERLAPGPPRP